MDYLNVDLPLFNEPDYIYQVALENNSYSLRFIYNETMKLTTLSIYDVDKTPVLCGVGLVPNYPIAVAYALPNFTGCFVMSSKSNIDTQFYKLYPDKLATYYNLSYVYNETV